jgi:hypothetical protein
MQVITLEEQINFWEKQANLAEIYKLEYLESSIDKHLAYLYSLQK